MNFQKQSLEKYLDDILELENHQNVLYFSLPNIQIFNQVFENYTFPQNTLSIDITFNGSYFLRKKDKDLIIHSIKYSPFESIKEQNQYLIINNSLNPNLNQNEIYEILFPIITINRKKEKFFKNSLCGLQGIEKY